MLQLSKLDVELYLLPDQDGKEARTRFLDLLKDPGETWGAAYSFTDSLLVSAIRRADRLGVPNHWLLDSIQSSGLREHIILNDLHLTCGDVTLSTAGPYSAKPDAIMHNKVVVCRATDGGEDWCWVGSVNFSESGWYQANTALLFRSNVYAREHFIPWFEKTREWARKHVPQHPSVAATEVQEWDEGIDTESTDISVPDWLLEAG